jgi:hypothetical protein
VHANVDNACENVLHQFKPVHRSASPHHPAPR